MIDKTVLHDYKLVKKLGAGAFGEVFMAIHNRNHTEVAVKLESLGSRAPQLFYEAKILNILNDGDSSTDHGVPRVYYCAS